MTRRDYEAIAGAIARAHRGRGAITGGAIEMVAEYVADVLAADNPRFDRERFLAACGGESDA